MGDALDQPAAQAPAGRPATPDEMQRPLSFWRRIVPVSSTAQDSPLTDDAPPFDDTGHFAFETHAQEIATTIRDFLDRKLTVPTGLTREIG